MTTTGAKVLVTLLLLGSSFAAFSAPARVESCTAKVDTFNLNAADKSFVAAAARINQAFGVVRKGIAKNVPAGPAVPRGTERLSIKAETINCINSKSAVKSKPPAPLTLSSCNYVGCVESLGPDYSAMPIGSTVTISTCGSNVSTTRSYTKDHDGEWVMVSFRQEFGTQCEPFS